MFTNYHYFLVLAKEGNMTRSAEHLFISHQNLSKYLSNLETDFGITLFERKPSFWLTSAEQSMYEALCQVKSLERNLRDDRGGEITLGTTEGRFRSLMPNLINDFKNASSDVHLRIVSAASPELQETEGAELPNFQQMPFALNLPYFNSSMLLKRHLEKIGASLDCVHVSSHPDLHPCGIIRPASASSRRTEIKSGYDLI